jgi:hypothetical protein
MPQYVYDFCISYYTEMCGKLVDGCPATAKLLFGVSSKSECGGLANKECSFGEGEDDCNPVWPSQSELDACMADSKKLTCQDFMNNPQGPASCQKIAEPCPEPDQPDAGPGMPDGSRPAGDGPQPPLPDAGNLCPYATSSFSCDSACQNIWKLVQACANDPSLPANLAAVMKTMASLPEARAMAACKATCTSSSQSSPAQWGCFQAAPTDSCAKVAGCTATNCP